MTIVRLNRIPRVNAWRPARPTAKAWSDTAQVGDWPATVVVLPTQTKPCPPCSGECETLGRQCPPARVGLGAWIVAKVLAAVMLLALAGLAAVGAAVVIAGAVAAGWFVAYIVPPALDAAVVWLLTWMGVL